MKPGDLVRLIPEMESNDDSRPLWDDPPDFTSIYMKSHTGRFCYNDVGMVLEQKHILDGPLHVQTVWIKLLSPGGMGWMKRCDLELLT
jgi:hypothetical protein